MDRPLAPTDLHVQWRSPGDEEHVDRLVAVILRQNRKVAAGLVRPWILWATFLVMVPFVVALWPWGLLLPIALATFVYVLKVETPKRMATTFRDQPTVRDPYTITLDTEGFHVVSPNVADHLRWSVFDHADIDDDVLVLRTRGSRFLRAIPLGPLDPAVDRAALVVELNRLIEASAPAAAPA
jgi:hypothetical protein